MLAACDSPFLSRGETGSEPRCTIDALPEQRKAAREWDAEAHRSPPCRVRGDTVKPSPVAPWMAETMMTCMHGPTSPEARTYPYHRRQCLRLAGKGDPSRRLVEHPVVAGTAMMPEGWRLLPSAESAKIPVPPPSAKRGVVAAIRMLSVLRGTRRTASGCLTCFSPAVEPSSRSLSLGEIALQARNCAPSCRFVQSDACL